MPAPTAPTLPINGQGRQGLVPTADGHLPLLFDLGQAGKSSKPGRVRVAFLSAEKLANKRIATDTFRLEMN